MKRYWLFAFGNFYPIGGMRDFVKDFDSINEAKEHFENSDQVWCNILDTKKKVVVYDSDLPKKYEVHGFDSIGKDEDKEELLIAVTDSHLKKLYPVDLWE